MDFFNSIIYDTVYILNLINEAEISAKEKTFYKRILKSKLRDTEKFFLVVFYIQIHNSIKDYITREELVELAGPKEWILKPLYLSDNFPFCIPGMCFGNSFDIDIPQVHYHSTLANFLKADFFYLVKLIKNLDTQCSKMLIQINEDSGNKFEVPLIDIEFRNRIWHFNLKSFLKKYFSNGADLTTIQPITFFTGAQPYLENHRTFFLHIEIQMILNNDTYTILDKIMFQLNANGEIFININSTKNTAWDWNWRAWSFREDNPA
jgi:hypothetical protein